MKRQGHEQLRVWIMGAAALGMFGWEAMAQAQTRLPFLPLAKKPAVKTNTTIVVEPPRLLPVPEGNAVSIRPVSQVQPVSKTETVAATEPGQKSEVMRQLELLYEKDGREMPELEVIQPVPTNGAPATGTPPATPATPATPQKAVQPQSPASAPALRTQTAPASQPASNSGKPNLLRPAQPAAQPKPVSSASTEVESSKSKNPVVGFFKKLMPGNKEPKTSATPPGYQPNVAPVPPAAMARPSQGPAGTGFSQPPSGQRQYAPFEATARTNNKAGTVPAQQQPATLSNLLPAPTATAPEALPGPATDETAAGSTTSPLPPLFAQPKSLTSTTASAQPGAAEFELPAPAGSSDFADPFTEMSEEEADDEDDIDPYTGLTLDDEELPATPSAKTADLPNVATPKEAAPKDAAPSEDPFAEELRKLGILPPAEAEAPKIASTPAEPPSLDGIEDEATREKMQKIRERGGMKGLKGFCPVTLHDERELVDAKPDFHATYRGQKFHFASAETKAKFDEEPSRYAPAAYGADVVALTRDKDVVEGSLDFAAWFKGRLYLFGSQEAHDTFVANPVQYATPAGIE